MNKICQKKNAKDLEMDFQFLQIQKIYQPINQEQQHSILKTMDIQIKRNHFSHLNTLNYVRTKRNIMM